MDFFDFWTKQKSKFLFYHLTSHMLPAEFFLKNKIYFLVFSKVGLKNSSYIWGEISKRKIAEKLLVLWYVQHIYIV